MTTEQITRERGSSLAHPKLRTRSLAPYLFSEFTESNSLLINGNTAASNAFGHSS
ncbi:hypothetical protein HanXRQr2_Chr12g0529881 [Helianthus annuus]|uniref:Uncharacterized protein n=1 Tax=Helianthus annuus TaxID=4232 RepID=A0A9K3EP52_HELAN|nr:hypothetical protein HanXRQr2_Chr12g0529881 [Helianthus annuus]KAJ0861784.1 hypothetical protein HanPSC8_Chr12g0510561 [Helianthus annuus]